MFVTRDGRASIVLWTLSVKCTEHRCMTETVNARKDGQERNVTTNFAPMNVTVGRSVSQELANVLHNGVG